MKVALLGATGFVGSAILSEALDRGHKVTAIVRDVGKLPARDGLVAKSCDIFETAQLAALLRGHDAVISAFNPGWKIRISTKSRSKAPHLSSQRLRRLASAGSCGWAAPEAWRSNPAFVLSTRRTFLVG